MKQTKIAVIIAIVVLLATMVVAPIVMASEPSNMGSINESVKQCGQSGPEGLQGPQGQSGYNGRNGKNGRNGRIGPGGPRGKTRVIYYLDASGHLKPRLEAALQTGGYRTESQLTQKYDARYEFKQPTQPAPQTQTSTTPLAQPAESAGSGMDSVLQILLGMAVIILIVMAGSWLMTIATQAGKTQLAVALTNAIRMLTGQAGVSANRAQNTEEMTIFATSDSCTIVVKPVPPPPPAAVTPPALPSGTIAAPVITCAPIVLVPAGTPTGTPATP